MNTKIENHQTDQDSGLSVMEPLKRKSRFLRGTIDKGLADLTTGAIAEPDTKLLKFHGSYMQDDRDIRQERLKQKLEPDYRFMVRVRLPGGVISAQQWLALDELASLYANRGLRITTRQTFQYHGIRKEHLRSLMYGIHQAGLSTLAACGDVVRNVVASVNPLLSSAHAEVFEWSQKLMVHLQPQTKAYEELWIEQRSETTSGENDSEPLLGATYLPRKFKFGIAIPPYNDIDVFAQDVGFIAIIDKKGVLRGFNVVVGGGMGADRGDKPTYARVGDVIGYVDKKNLLDVAYHCVTIQRDFGDRKDRMHARFKYTVEDLGTQRITELLQERTGGVLKGARDFSFEHNGDRFGWLRGEDDKWHLTLRIPCGRLWDGNASGSPEAQGQTGIREIAKIHKGDLRMTCNQNVIVAGVAEEDKAAIDALVQKYGLSEKKKTIVRQRAIACVALPTCGLAMAESERYLPEFLDLTEALLAKHGLENEPLHVRISGCPNGCSRPFLGEIALVGRSIGRYDLYLGANQQGSRLNRIYRQNIKEDEILSELDGLFGRFAQERLNSAEQFGDFVMRSGVFQ